MALGPAPGRLEERSEQKRADAEEDQAVRPVTGREENEREDEGDDGDAEQEAWRRHPEPARLDLPV
jgi:hypothetical protein